MIELSVLAVYCLLAGVVSLALCAAAYYIGIELVESEDAVAYMLGAISALGMAAFCLIGFSGMVEVALLTRCCFFD